MKKTCFLAMLAAALMGGQVCAEITGTTVDGYEVVKDNRYYGKYSETGSVSGGNVIVKAEATGQVPDNAYVYGGNAENADASNNTVTMQGGKVANITGGYGQAEDVCRNTVTMQGGDVTYIRGGWGQKSGNAINNTVVMTGGKVQTLYGGNAANEYSASGNVVIVTGGSISTVLCSGYAGAAANNNKTHLVGKGVSNVNIADAKGVISTSGYTGDVAGISLHYVYGGYAPKGTSTGNSIDIYGTGIEISGRFAYMQVLTFNITNEAVTDQTPEVAVNLTSTSPNDALDLTDIDLQVKDLDVKEWTTGKTITLVQSKQEIKGASEELKVGKVVDITDATGAKVAQGKLQLVDGVEGTHLLNLTIQGSVPEPTTGTLSLLALAGLCMRKRRK